MERLLRLEGVEATRRTTRVDDLTLHHLEVGSGPPLVLLHGASGGGANWYRLMPTLARTHRVLALDLPGFGFSSAMEPIAPLGRNAARIVAAWLQQNASEAADVAGTSFGSLVALRLAQAHPGRVRRVALVNGVGLGRELPFALRAATRPPWAKLALRPSRWGTRWQFENLMIAKGARLPQEHVDALIEYLWQSAASADQSRMTRAFSGFSGWSGQREILTDDELRAFAAPLLIAWGDQDRFLPIAHGQRAAALVPRALFRIIPRAGHSPNWEAPHLVLEAMTSFLVK